MHMGLSTPLGRARALVLLARFAEEAPGNTQSPSHAASLFDPDRPGSLSHFYTTMSAGRFTLDGVVHTRRYEAPLPASSYVAREDGDWGFHGQFVRHVLELADADVDFRQYDNDGPDGVPDSGDDDGWVDYIFVSVHSTPRGFIRGGATGIAGLGGLLETLATDDVGASGRPILIAGDQNAISVVAEGPFAEHVGTMAHEFGHAFGLVDLFDGSYGDGADDSAGIGRWGLMDWGAHGWRGGDGPNGFSAFSLEQLGWIDPDDGTLVNVVEDGHVAIRDINHGGAVFHVPLTAKTYADNFVDEYLLLEYRSRDRFYGREMPADGLLIWHVRPLYSTNSNESRKLADLVCADGLFLSMAFATRSWPDTRIPLSTPTSHSAAWGPNWRP